MFNSKFSDSALLNSFKIEKSGRNIAIPYLFTRSAFLYMMFKTHGFSLLFAGEALGSCISGGYKNLLV